MRTSLEVHKENPALQPVVHERAMKPPAPCHVHLGKERQRLALGEQPDATLRIGPFAGVHHLPRLLDDPLRLLATEPETLFVGFSRLAAELFGNQMTGEPGVSDFARNRLLANEFVRNDAVNGIVLQVVVDEE